MQNLNSEAMVIVGAGHCGGLAALALREKGWGGPIHLIGNEAHDPYERPPLSKGLLTGGQSAASCTLLTGATMDAQSITRHVAQVIKIDAAHRCVTLSTGLVLGYAALLLATGGRVRQLSCPGGDLAQVLTLRNLDDAAQLAPRLRPGVRLAVIGGGFIGLEVAASARQLGCEVTLIEAGPRLMARAVPERMAQRAHALHQAHGVKVLLNAQLECIEPLPGGDAVAVVLANGTRHLADTVLVGIGIEPSVELAQAAGLNVQRGIVVDRYLRSSDPHIFAAGDVAVFPSVNANTPIRQETWHNAQTQSGVVATNMIGSQEPYASQPWFWSDQFDHQLQVCGEPALASSQVTRSLEGDDLMVFYQDAQGKLVGACGWGLTSRVAKELKLARTLVERGVTASAESLANPQVKLKSLLTTG